MTTNNSKLPISHMGKTVFVPHFSPHQLQVDQVYIIPGMKKNLLLVSQLTFSGNYVVFGPKVVKLYRNLKLTSPPLMEGR